MNITEKTKVFVIILSIIFLLCFCSGCSAPIVSYNSTVGGPNVIQNKARVTITIERVHQSVLNNSNLSSIKESIKNDLSSNLLNLTSFGDYEIDVAVNVNLLTYNEEPWGLLWIPLVYFGVPSSKYVGEAAVNFILTDKDGKFLAKYESTKIIKKWSNLYNEHKQKHRVLDISLRLAMKDIKKKVTVDSNKIISLIGGRKTIFSENKSSTLVQNEVIPQTFKTGLHWAVVIGVSKYNDSEITPLRYASKDAKAFHDWLISPSGGKYSTSQMKLITDEQSTYQNIREALFVWLQQALAEDVVTFYFAGHGSPESPDSPDNLFFLPFDTKYDNIATTAFPMWDIETALKRFIKAKKVVVIADACHSGGVGQAFDIARRASRGIKKNTISAGFQNLSQIGDGVCVISASDADQYSQEGQQWGGGHGVFTHTILEGLKGNADYNNDSYVTLGELIPYLSQTVRRETRNAQSPTVSGKFDPALSIAR